jgi:hypothetical protein
MLEEVYNVAEMKKTYVHKWHKLFYDGCMSVDDDLCYRLLSTSVTN